MFNPAAHVLTQRAGFIDPYFLVGAVLIYTAPFLFVVYIGLFV